MTEAAQTLLSCRMRGVVSSAQTLGVWALFLTVSHTALAKDPKDTAHIKPPEQASGLFMEEATYGDIIGLQPGFEQVTTGKTLSIAPAVAAPVQFKKATPEVMQPAKVSKAALNNPANTAPLAPKQFITDVAPILPQDFLALSLSPINTQTQLLTAAEEKQIRKQQKLADKARKTALAELKSAEKISVAAQSRDVNALQKAATSIQKPELALSLTPLNDAISAEVPTLSAEPKPALSAQRTFEDRFVATPPPALDFAEVDGAATDIKALTQAPRYLSLASETTPLTGDAVTLSVSAIDTSPAAWSGIMLTALERPAALVSEAEYAQLDADIARDEIASFNVSVAALERDLVLYTPELVADAQGALSQGLTKAQSLSVIDMVGLPGDARVLNVKDEDRATLVASVKTTSTEYTPQPIGVGGLETLRDAVEHAVATNPDIKIAEAQQEDAYYAINEARAGFLPKVNLNAGAGPEISRQSGAEEIIRVRREVNATLRQTVFDFGLTRYDYLRAKESYEAAKLDTLQSIETLVYDVSVAYLGVLQQQKVVALAHQNLEAHEGILDLVTAQKEAGQGTAADVNRVSSSLANARSFMLEEESKLQQSRDEYRRLLNAPPGMLIDPLLDFSILPQTAEDAAQRIEAESPQLLQVKADVKTIENQLRSQRGNYLPKLEVEVQGNLNTDLAGETGQTRDARAMMFLRYNIYNGGADVATSARLRARIKEIGYEFEKQRREVEQSIRNDFTAIEASRAKVETIRDQVNSAQEVVRLYEEQFRAGDRTAFDLLDAQQALISAKLEQVLNIYQETRSAFRVMQQLGALYYGLTSDD